MTNPGDDGDAGFSLLEVIVSFVIFAFVAAGATLGIVSAIQSSNSSEARVNAAGVGQQDLSLDLASYRAGTMPRTAVYSTGTGTTKFSVSRTVAYNSGATACAPGNSFTVHVAVSQKVGGTVLAQTDTVIAC